MESSNSGRIEVVLDNKAWYMKQMNPGQGVKERLYEMPSERDIGFTGWNKARIPGDVYSDLQRAGVIDDPYMGRNLLRLSWVQYYEWWYVCRFNVPKAYKDMDLQLVLEGVDYSYEIWLNGVYLGKHEGMFSYGTYDITKYVNTYLDEKDRGECDNQLMIKIDVAPQSLYNIAGKHHTFSGDYLPGFVPVGIWRTVKIIGTKKARIDNLYAESKIKGEDALVSVKADVELKAGYPTPCTVSCKIYCDDERDKFIEETRQMNLYPGSNDIEFDMDVENAKLWWPWDMGEQPLYHAEITIVEDNVVLDNTSVRFGIREIKMAMNPGYTQEEAEYPWTFVINGKPMFLRSGCWGGPPSFLYGRNSNKKYSHFLKLAKECNLNNLRIFGWHPPEVPEFYDMCDELGITVWTNFPLSSQVFRDDTEYVNSVLSECREIVTQRRNHPSNIFFMGGEEVFFSEGQIRSHNKRLMKQVGEETKRYTNVPYGDASMMSSPMSIRLGYKTKECIHANGEYYGAGRHFMEDYFPKIDCCIIPELTAASAPCMESLRKFVPKDELWPVGPTWSYLKANVDILRILNLEVLGSECFGSIEEFCEATQVSQGEIFKFAIEVIRRKKPHISGVAICHFITNRPMMKWEIVDYYGKPKKSFEYVKKAYQPIVPSIEYDKRRWLPEEVFKGRVWVINDYYKEYSNAQCRIKIYDSHGALSKTLEHSIDVPENSSKYYFDFDYNVEGEIGEKFKIEIGLYDGDNLISENDYNILIDDDKKAREECLKLANERQQKMGKYANALYHEAEDEDELE